MKRLLLPLDGWLRAETALAPTTALAQRFAAELSLFGITWAHIIPGTNPGSGQMKTIVETQAYLETIATQLRKAGLPVRSTFPYAAPAAGIVDQAAFRRIDPMVIVDSGRTGPAALLHPQDRLGGAHPHQRAPARLEGLGCGWCQARLAAGDGWGLRNAGGLQDGSRLVERARPMRSSEEASARQAKPGLGYGPDAHSQGSARSDSLDESRLIRLFLENTIRLIRLAGLCIQEPDPLGI